MRLPIDFHIVSLAMIICAVMLLLHKVVPTGVGVSVLALLLQFPLLTRMADCKGRTNKLSYFIANELIVVAGTGVYLIVRFL